jgi:hypothetical protein
MIGGYLRSTSCLAMVAAAGFVLGSVSAQAADLGGNCCADLEERVAELEATTARKGNRKVSLQIYGQVSETVMWWNDGAESNAFVLENNNIKNTLGFQGSAKINSDWSAGFKLELQIRAYRSSAASQLALGASNGVSIPAYNTQSVSLRHAYWFMKSNTYGTLTVGRDVDAATGTSSISLVNPDGFAGPAGPGFANGGFFLRRAGTTGNAGLSGRTWQSTAWINNGDGPLPFDYAQTNSGVKYTSPFFLGQTKSSGFLLSANWGMDDSWAAALRYVEDFGAVRVAAGVSYGSFGGPDRGFCTNPTNQASGAAPTFADAQSSTLDCNAIQASGSLLHVPTGLFVSGGYAELNNKNAQLSALNATANQQFGISGKSSFWYVMGGWQAKLNSLGNTIFWGQYVDVSAGLNGTNGTASVFGTGDQLSVGLAGVLGATAIIRSAHTTSWGLGVSQEITAAAMTLYAGFHNISTDITLGSTTTTNRAKSNPIDDMQIFYTGATIKF